MIYRFNQFKVDTENYQLWHSEEPVSIEPLVFDVLVYLIEHRERQISREELHEKLWKGKVVTDAALGARIKDARRAAGDSGSEQNVIKTIHGRGYQFVARLLEPASVLETLTEESDFLSLPDKPSIAVLPFVNLSNDPEQDYFSDGITDDIITALSKIKNLLVIAKSSTSIYQNDSPDLDRVGREQGVRYVLQGRVRKGGHRIRVTVQLIEASTGELVWADSYDRELKDVFAVQDEIMREVVVALDVQLIEGEQARAWSSGTTNFEAWECVRRSVTDAYSGDPEVKFRAKQLLEKALEIDPSYAIAWVLLGWIYQQYVDVASLARELKSNGNSLASMLDCTQKALDADPSCADAYGLYAMYYLEKKEYTQALEMAEKAVLLAPDNALNLAEASMVMNKTGSPQRALELNKRAMRICPMYRPGILRGLGLSFYLMGKTDQAIRAFNESIAREPEYLSAYTSLTAIYGELGKTAESRKIVGEIKRLAPDFSVKAYVSGLSFSDMAVIDRFETGLRKAGLKD